MTLIHTTIRPSDTLDVDAAELESLTRQGLIVGVPAPTHVIIQDPVAAYVTTTLQPHRVLGVDDAELESLTRQHLISSNFGLTRPAQPVTAAGSGLARGPAASVAVRAEIATAVGVGNPPGIDPYGGAGYGTAGYGISGYGA